MRASGRQWSAALVKFVQFVKFVFGHICTDFFASILPKCPTILPQPLRKPPPCVKGAQTCLVIGEPSGFVIIVPSFSTTGVSSCESRYSSIVCCSVSFAIR